MSVAPRLVFSNACLLLICLSEFAFAEFPPPSIQLSSPDTFQLLKEVYATDSTIPLEARTVEKALKEGLIREKIVFRGVQGELVPGYLQLPNRGTAPFPCVLLMHGWSGSKENWWVDDNYISGGNVRKALIEQGYAIVALDAQAHGDRISVNDFAPVNHFQESEKGPTQRKGYLTQREIYIQTTRDYRRAIDYLVTRPEIDPRRIGIFGYSMGGAQAYLLCGVEPRIKCAVSCCAPRDVEKSSPIAPQNLLPGMGDRPFLTIMGRTDELCPIEHAQFIHSLNPSKSKEMIVLEAGHKFPHDFVPLAIDWIRDRL